MKVYYQNRHVKTIPERFAAIPDICDHFEDLDSIRLTRHERSLLAAELCREEIETLKKSQKPAIYELVKNDKPVAAVVVCTKHSTYQVIKFSSGVELKCSDQLFKDFPVKYRIKRLY